MKIVQTSGLANGTLVFTPHGWRPIEELSKRDRVYGPDGWAHSVIRVHRHDIRQGKDSLYRVTFDDGRSVKCAFDSPWKLRVVGWPAKVYSTGELQAMEPWGAQLFLPHVYPVQNDNTITMSDVRSPYLLGTELCEKGFIPPGFLDAGPKQREKILQGFLDSRLAHSSARCTHVSDISEQLVKDLSQLARSLGHRTEVLGANELRIPHGRHPYVAIRSIERAGNGYVTQIKVGSPDGTFLAQDFIPATGVVDL